MQPGAKAIRGCTATPRKRRFQTRLAVLVCALGMVPSVAYAKTMREKMQAACTDDIARLCPAESADGDRLKACLLQHRTTASAQCMKLIDTSE